MQGAAKVFGQPLALGLPLTHDKNENRYHYFANIASSSLSTSIVDFFIHLALNYKSFSVNIKEGLKLDMKSYVGPYQVSDLSESRLKIHVVKNNILPIAPVTPSAGSYIPWHL